MRLIKLAILSFIIIFAIITVISLLIPSQIRISKAIDLSHKKENVIRLLTDTSAWKTWHPVFIKDSRNFSMLAATYKVTAVTDSLVLMEVDLNAKHKLVYGWQFHHYPGVEKYTVQWFTDFNLGWYPWEKFGSLFYEKTYGLMMEQGLKNLDSVLKAENTPPVIK